MQRFPACLGRFQRLNVFILISHIRGPKRVLTLKSLLKMNYMQNTEACMIYFKVYISIEQFFGGKMFVRSRIIGYSLK